MEGKKKRKGKRGTPPPPFPVMYTCRGAETCRDHGGRPGCKTDSSSELQTERCEHALRNHWPQRNKYSLLFVHYFGKEKKNPPRTPSSKALNIGVFFRAPHARVQTTTHNAAETACSLLAQGYSRLCFRRASLCLEKALHRASCARLTEHHRPQTLQTFKIQLRVPSDMPPACPWLAPCVKENVTQMASAQIISSNHPSHFSPACAGGHIHLVTVC